MNARLGKEVTRAMAHARMDVAATAKAAQVSESWVKQMRTGRIDRPPADKLVKLADVLGAEARTFLALADRLGEPTETTTATDDLSLAAAIRALTAELAEARKERTELAGKVERMAAVLDVLAPQAMRGEGVPAAPHETTGSGR